MSTGGQTGRWDFNKKIISENQIWRRKLDETDPRPCSIPAFGICGVPINLLVLPIFVDLLTNEVQCNSRGTQKSRVAVQDCNMRRQRRRFAAKNTRRAICYDAPALSGAALLRFTGLVFFQLRLAGLYPYIAFRQQTVNGHCPIRLGKCKFSGNWQLLTTRTLGTVIPAILDPSQWQCSPPARTTESWVQIPLGAWMYAFLLCLCSLQVATLRRVDSPSNESY